MDKHLGPNTLAEDLEATFQQDEHVPHEIPGIDDAIGKLGLMHPRNYALQHDAATLLQDYAQNGCPVDAGEDWTIEQIQDALERERHKSAYLDGAAAFLQRETTEKIKNGYARVVKWSDIKDNLPTNLKISLVAMVPHKSKDFRCILDLSFKMKKKDGSYWNSVNSATTKLAKCPN